MLPMLPNYAALLTVAQDQEDNRLRLARYTRAWEAYNGRYPKPLRQTPEPPDLNFARRFVQAGVSFLFGGAGLTIATDPDARERNPQEQYLDDVLKANGGGVLWSKLGINGGVTGDVWAKLQRRSRLTGDLPRIVALDPSHVTAFWEADDMEDVFAYRIEWADIDRRTGKPIEYRQDIERTAGGRWTITDYRRAAGGRWEQDGGEPWPYPFPPVLHCQNDVQPNEYYGMADLNGDVLDLIETQNFTWANLMRIMEIYAHPFMYGVGLASAIDRDPKKMPNLPPGASIAMLQAQGVDESSINVYLRLKEALHAIAEVPEVATGKLDSVGQLSGLALKILYGPLVEKTLRKRLTYGALIEELCRRVLVLGEQGEADVTLTWPEAVPSDPQAEAATLEAHARLGVSKSTLLDKLDYDPEAEAEKRQAESQEAIDQAAAMAKATGPREGPPRE